jgi:chaperonin GroES
LFLFKEKLMSATAKKAGKEKTSTRIVPLGDRVVLKRADAESRTKGGIVLPDTAKDKPQKGEVISVGEGYIRDDGSRVPLTVKAGDDVIFSAYGGEEIRIGEEEYLLLRESDILATF